MYRDEYQEDYRPGYNPEFLKAVLAKRAALEVSEEEQRRLRRLSAEKRAARERAKERERVRAERQAAFAALREHQEAIDAILARLDILPDDKFKHTYREIERRACSVFRTSRTDLTSGRRSKEMILARQFIMYWTSRLTPLSYPQIGRMMGGKDHTTVMSGCKAYVTKRARMGRHLPSKASFYARQHTDRET